MATRKQPPANIEALPTPALVGDIRRLIDEAKAGVFETEEIVYALSRQLSWTRLRSVPIQEPAWAQGRAYSAKLNMAKAEG